MLLIYWIYCAKIRLVVGDIISEDKLKKEIFSRFYIGFTPFNIAVFIPVPCQCSFHSLLKWEIKTKEMLEVFNVSALWPDEHLPFCDFLVLRHQQPTLADTVKSSRCIQVHMEQRRQSSQGKTEILCSLNCSVQFRPILFQDLRF